MLSQTGCSLIMSNDKTDIGLEVSPPYSLTFLYTVLIKDLN